MQACMLGYLALMNTISLLSYRPRAVLSPAFSHLPGMAALSAYLKVYSIVSPVDSTDTIRTPVRMQNAFPLPKLTPMKKTYEELCDARAREILDRAARLDAPIYVSYSGGIDSTLVTVSLLKAATATERKRIVLLLTEESITENPNFYYDHIRGKLDVLAGMKLPLLLGNKAIFTSGELNDQLFGSDVIATFITQRGARAIQGLYSAEDMSSFFDTIIRDLPTSRLIVATLEKTFASSPVPIRTNFEALWWYNFDLKWQSVFFRSLLAVHPSRAQFLTKAYVDTHYMPFFCTDEFRLWSMHNPDKKIKDTWETYKWPAKDVIYDYNKDKQYRDHKLKKGSLWLLLRQQELYNFLDENYAFHTALDLKDFHVPHNDFLPAAT